MPETSLNRLTPRERYMRDSVFRTLVDVLSHHIDRCDYTATEVREAALLAACMSAERTIHPMSRSTTIFTGHTCIRDDGGTPNRRCDACEAEREFHPKRM